MKKCFSLLLAALLLFTALPFAAGAVEIEEVYDTSKPPILFIDGINGADLLLDAGTKEERVAFPFTADDVLSLIKDNLGAVWDILDGDFSQESEDALVNAVIALLEDVAMNDDGASRYNVEVDWLYPLQTREREDGGEAEAPSLGDRLNALKNWFRSLFQRPAEELTEEEMMRLLFQRDSTYKFQYDWRLDPYELAARLRDYIEYMKELTGFDTVSLVGFSQGAAVLNTYLSVYGYDDLEAVIWCVGAHNGVELVGQLFTGRISVDNEALTRFLSDPEQREPSAELLSAVARQLNALGMTGNILQYTNKIIDKLLADGAIRRVIRETVGKMPAIWSLIGDEYYEEAKAWVFNEPGDAERFADLLETIDAYHYNVQAHSYEIMAQAKAATGKIGVISKYGRRVIPLIENADIQADGLIDVKGASCGATAADVGLTLGPDYRQAVNDGHNHLSPDGVIDASTALYPDYTWFIKNLEHSTGCEYQRDLFRRICYAETQLTVFDDPDFPQFAVYSPIDGETAPLTDGGSNNLFRRALLRMKMYFTELWQKLRNCFAGLLPR